MRLRLCLYKGLIPVTTDVSIASLKGFLRNHILLGPSSLSLSLSLLTEGVELQTIIIVTILLVGSNVLQESKCSNDSL